MLPSRRRRDSAVSETGKETTMVRTKNTVAEIGNFTSSNRIIRKVVLLDPMKIKKLGLESRIIQAVNKFNDKPVISKEQALCDNNKGTFTKKCIEYESEDYKVSLASKAPKNKSDQLSDKVDQRIDEVALIANSNEIIRNSHKRQLKLGERQNAEKDFNGFTEEEIAVGHIDLIRLSNIVTEYKQILHAEIPSFKHLRTYLCSKKRRCKDKINKSDRSLSCSLSSLLNSPGIQDNGENLSTGSSISTVAEEEFMNPSTFETDHESKSNEVTSAQNTGTGTTCYQGGKKFSKIIGNSKQNENGYEQKDDECVDRRRNLKSKTLDSSLATSCTSNKGIVILDQKIIKSGTDSRPQTESSSKQKSKLAVPKNDRNFASKQADRTILVKILGQDSQSKDIHIEVIDPLINMQPPEEPVDPIKTICKSYVRKMLKSSGIKRIKINAIEGSLKKLPMCTKTACNLKVKCETLCDCDTKPNDTLESWEDARKCSELNSVSTTPIIKFPHESKNPSIVTFGAENFSPIRHGDRSLVNEQKSQEDNNMNFRSTSSTPGSSISRVKNDEPMDAVEYILHCTKDSDIVNYVSKFEDEDDLIDDDWADQDDDAGDLSCQQVTNENSESIADVKSSFMDESNCNIINMIKKAEITFESDVKNEQDAHEKNVNLKTSKCEVKSDQLISDDTTHLTSVNDSISVFTIKEISTTDEASSEVSANIACQAATDAKCRIASLKKRKCTIMNYRNMNTTLIAEIKERIKQRMIGKSTTLNKLLPVTGNKEKSTDEFEHLERLGTKLCDKVSCKKMLANKSSLEGSININKAKSNTFIPKCDIEHGKSISRSMNVKMEDDTQIQNEDSFGYSSVQNNESCGDKIEKLNLIAGDLESKFQFAQKKRHPPHGKGRRLKITPVVQSRFRLKHETSKNIEVNSYAVSVNCEKGVSGASADLDLGSTLEFEDRATEANIKSCQTKKRPITDKKGNCLIGYANANLQKGNVFVEMDITKHFDESVTSLDRNMSEVLHVDDASELRKHTANRIIEQEYSSLFGKCSGDEHMTIRNDSLSKERKSNRIRKPTNKKDFIPSTKKRKERPQKEQVVKNLKTFHDSDQQKRKSEVDEVKIHRSRRKNTIPEIDKLALKRRSMKAEFDNLCVKEDNLNMKGADSERTGESIERDLIMTETIPDKRETNDMSAAYSNLTPLCEDMPYGFSKANRIAEIKCIDDIARKRGRPRKNAINKTISSIALPLNAELVNSTVEDSPPDCLDSNERNCSKCETTNVLEEPLKKRRKGNASDYEIHPKILLVTRPEELQKAEMKVVSTIKNEPIVDKEAVQCGACKRFVKNSFFKEHLKEHYGVGWREGFDKPVNLCSYREVMNAIHYYMLRNKIVSMSCKVCGEAKKSAAGIIMHLQSCLLDEQQLNELSVICEFCSKTFLPPAFWTHSKTCRKNPDHLTKDIIIKENTPDLESRRKSAIKANSSFKALIEPSYKLSVDDLIKSYQIPRLGGLVLRWKNEIKKNGVAKCFEKDCTFDSAEIFAMKSHIKSCSCIRHGGYYCVRCEFYDIEKESVRQHVLEQHSKHLNANIIDASNVAEASNDSSVSEHDLEMSEDGEDGEIDCERQINAAAGCRKSIGTKEDNIFAGTEKIYDGIYTSNILYPNLTPEISSFSTNVESLKPSIVKSIKFGFTTAKKVNEFVGSSKPPPKWNELGQFEMKKLEDEIIIFVGGPVTHISWAPIMDSKKNDTEYLAVSYKSSYKSHRKFIESPEEINEVILIYQVTLEGVKKREITNELLYGIQCNGRVNCFGFLPSGGYAPDINRLGVLAVGTSASCINIYSLPLKASRKNCDNVLNTQPCTLLDLKPSLILCIDLSKPSTQTDTCKAQCTRIVWSEIKNHNIIGAGFSNGYVGLWDIRENNITKLLINGYRFCVPLSYFHAIAHAVSGLAMHYAATGPRWLFVTSRTRELQAYDLEDITYPIPLGPVVYQKSCLSSIVWPVYSENPVVALDDDYLDETSMVFCRSILNLSYKMKNIIHCPSGFKCLEFTPWYNSLVGGCENGDIVVQRFRKFSMESSLSNMYPRWYVYFTDIIRLDGDPIPVVNPKQLEGMFLDSKLAETLDSFEPDYNNTHALIFGGPIACDRHNKSKVISNNRVIPTSLRPLTRINCIAASPNVASSDIAAIGYNNGLVRIKMINFKNFR